MIYLVSKTQDLFDSLLYKSLSEEDSIKIIESWDIVQFDTETSGRNAHLCDILCAQFGNEEADIQIVVDTSTVSILKYKHILENKLLVGHNLKFDCQFLFKYEIIPTKIWDTMIIEQLLHLGFDNKYFHYSLKAVAERRLGIDIDKTTRGEIIWRGLDPDVILYAAGDVQPLERIMRQQKKECISAQCEIGADIENAFVPVIAYLEWCGIRLNVNQWKLKIKDNELKLSEALKELNDYVIQLYHKDSRKYSQFIEKQLDLFDPGDKCNINWNSDDQLKPLFKILGFDLKSKDKQTGEIKESVSKKVIEKQKNVNPEFLKVYIKYTDTAKDASTYGINYIDAINPVTNRIHTIFKQLGASSGRMSCGGGNKQFDTDLAKFKHLSPEKCKFVQLQNLPSDELTRSSFIPNDGNLMTSCDYSALESRLGADIYQEPMMIEEYLHGSGDLHSLTAKACFPKELEGIAVKDIKDLRPDLRKKAKAPEFACQFGGGWNAIRDSLGCSKEEAMEIYRNYNESFSGISSFKERGARFVKTHGYVVICKKTGHKIYWQDWHKWKEIEDLPEFQQKYELSKPELDEHRKAAAKWERMALNSPTQGSGIICLKIAMIRFFKWIVANNYFNVVLLCNLVHDESVVEYPKELQEIVEPKLKECMETASGAICTSVPIPAVPETGDHWIH